MRTTIDPSCGCFFFNVAILNIQSIVCCVYFGQWIIIVWVFHLNTLENYCAFIFGIWRASFSFAHGRWKCTMAHQRNVVIPFVIDCQNLIDVAKGCDFSPLFSMLRKDSCPNWQMWNCICDGNWRDLHQCEIWAKTVHCGTFCSCSSDQIFNFLQNALS